MPHHCAFCRNPLRPQAAWKDSEEQFFCNEFCADAADDTAKQAARNQFRLQERQAA